MHCVVYVHLFVSARYGQPSNVTAQIADGNGTAAVVLQARHLWQRSDNQIVYFIDDLVSIRMVDRQNGSVTTLNCSQSPTI